MRLVHADVALERRKLEQLLSAFLLHFLLDAAVHLEDVLRFLLSFRLKFELSVGLDLD